MVGEETKDDSLNVKEKNGCYFEGRTGQVEYRTERSIYKVESVT